MSKSVLNQAGRILSWAVSSLLMAFVLYLAIAKGEAGAERVALFVIWLFFTISLFLVSDKIVRHLNMKSKPVIPKWIITIFNLSIVFVLIWHGWVASGIAYFIHLAMILRRYEPTATMADVFNEWARRYADDPSQFDEVLDKNGKPIADYGGRCETYFRKIESEMPFDGIVPKPAPWPEAAVAS